MSAPSRKRPPRKAIWGPKRKPRKAVWGPRRPTFIAALVAVAALLAGSHVEAAGTGRGRAARKDAPRASKLDRVLEQRAKDGRGTSRVIVRLKPGFDASDDIKRLGGKLGRRLSLIGGQVIEVSNGQLRRLAELGAVESIHDDRPVNLANYRTAVTVGAEAARLAYGYTGAGVGVAVIDSGVTNWHDDLTGGSGPYGNQRVAAFMDFVAGQALPYDDNGHGTHVAGTVTGNGYDSTGLHAGMAPGATLVSLKVLDGNGQGTISNIIAALDWLVANKDAYNIRVANLSVGAGVSESYLTDPLTLAARRAVDAGVVLVASAGNLGRNRLGQPQWGGITAPGNAPWVLTVGASSTMGTVVRSDDTMAGYSSRGPTYLDYKAKPDLVAPGTGTVSLSNPLSLFYTTKASFLVDGASELGLAHKPYLSLSGTSMAAPVVTGTVALMLQANPNLTPNLVKAILQYTAEARPGYSVLEQGAGLLNTLGAVELARFLASAQPGEVMPTNSAWSRRIIWGNRLLTGGSLSSDRNAWGLDVVWGDARTATGQNIVWGSMCDTPGCDTVVWGTAATLWGTTCTDPTCDTVVWGTNSADNVVWGSDCEGADCDNVVWGSSDTCDLLLDPLCDNIVWGNSAPGDNVVWGSNDACDPLVDLLCDNIVWGNSTDDDNDDNNDQGDNIVWGNNDTDNIVWGAVEELFDDLFAPQSPPASSTSLSGGAL